MAPSGKKILIVDDEPCICDLLENFLRQKGYGVARADNGTLALSLVEDGDIDLVITDIRMPGMTGIQLLQKIREYNSGIPVLVTTGYPTLDTAVQSLKLGVQDYLTKPFHLGEIGEKVRSAIDRRTIQEEHILFSKLVSLHQVTHILASTLDMAELDRKFLEFSVRFARADGAALFFADASGKLSLAARRGDVVGAAASTGFVRNTLMLLTSASNSGRYAVYFPFSIEYVMRMAMSSLFVARYRV